MAAIAEAESGGNSDAHNPSGASGLWQILGNPFPGNPFDPATNARMAVAKWRTQGLGAWVTYTSGAYKAYLSNKTTPAPPGTTPGSPSATTTSALTQGSLDCLVQNPLSVSLPVIGTVGAGSPCLFSMSNARAFIGAGLMVAGALIAFPGLGMLGAAAAVRVMQPIVNVAESVPVAGKYVQGARSAATTRAPRKPPPVLRSTPDRTRMAQVQRDRRRQEAAREAAKDQTIS